MKKQDEILNRRAHLVMWTGKEPSASTDSSVVTIGIGVSNIGYKIARSFIIMLLLPAGLKFNVKGGMGI
jgi:hypothetical protein